MSRVFVVHRPIFNDPPVVRESRPSKPLARGHKRHIGTAPSYLGFGRPTQSAAAQE